MNEAREALETWLFERLNEYDEVAEITNTDRAADASFLVHHLMNTPEGAALGARLVASKIDNLWPNPKTIPDVVPTGKGPA